ncbi:hypothetical protein ALI144C_09680 [Actinosynnema sp. ALI-1.44]|nr:hypothetical protein ALI144C_09680 [Actinosynnema sp. ALI-1.44]
MSAAQTLPGTLGYGTPRTVKGIEGRVTWLPAPGTTVSRGQPLYRVDDRPAALFYGGTPLFRRLDTPDLVGRDVRVVADNLKALGYPIGTQPRVGSTITQHAPQAGSPPPSGTAPAPPPTSPPPVKVGPEDAVLTPALIEAIKRWQGATGRPRTGALEISDIVVQNDAVRVTAVKAQPGDLATSELMVVSAQAKVVTVQMEPSTTTSVKKDDKVRLTLPGESTTSGTVSSIGTVVEKTSAQTTGHPQQKLAVAIALDDPQAVAAIDSAPVRAEFTGQTRTGVLAVPVGALLALREGGYALQPKDGPLIPVEIGLFAKGMVEVSGPKVAEGLQVVTTS